MYACMCMYSVVYSMQNAPFPWKYHFFFTYSLTQWHATNGLEASHAMKYIRCLHIITPMYIYTYNIIPAIKLFWPAIKLQIYRHWWICIPLLPSIFWFPYASAAAYNVRWSSTAHIAFYEFKQHDFGWESHCHEKKTTYIYTFHNRHFVFCFYIVVYTQRDRAIRMLSFRFIVVVSGTVQACICECACVYISSLSYIYWCRMYHYHNTNV